MMWCSPTRREVTRFTVRSGHTTVDPDVVNVMNVRVGDIATAEEHLAGVSPFDAYVASSPRMRMMFSFKASRRGRHHWREVVVACGSARTHTSVDRTVDAATRCSATKVNRF